MMHSHNAIYVMLNKNLAEVNTQIDAMCKELEKQIELLPYPEGVTVMEMRDRNGNYLLAPLLVAKAQILSAMAQLKSADMMSKIDPGKGRW